MAASTPLLAHIHQLVAPSTAALGTDAEMLQRFIDSRDQAAFAILVARHGPMVLRLCQRVLGDAHAAEDACQSAFLVLARKASRIRQPQTLSAWLHGVAHRLALKARAAEVRRRNIETQRLQSLSSPAAADPLAEVSGRELLAILDAELQRLPERYRLPLILCCLEGRTQAEAARLLGWTAGSVKGRLERGRIKLHQRLLKRGLTLPAALLALEAGGGAVSARLPALLSAAILRAASTAEMSAGISAAVMALAEEGMRGLVPLKLKLVSVLVLLGGIAAGGIGVLVQPRPAMQQQQEKQPAASRAAGPSLAEKEKQRKHTDRYGDPLPPGALLRLGTVRMRAYGFQLAFLPGDKQLVSAGGWSGNVGQVWDLSTGREVRRLETGNVYSRVLALSKDGKTAALAYSDEKKAILLFMDVDTGKPIRRQEIPGHKDIYSLTFTPDGQILTGWCDDDTIRFWDVATGREIRRMKGRQAIVLNLAISADGQTLASAGRDSTIRLWDVKTGAERHKLEGVSEFTTSLAFAPDGTTLASTGRNDKSIRLWDVKTGKLRQRLEGHEGDVYRTAYSPDGKLLASSAIQDCSIRLWDAATGRQVRRIDCGNFSRLSLVFSSDGKTLAAGCSDHVIHLWDTASGTEIRPGSENQSRLYSAAYSPEGKTIVTGSADETVRLWDASTGALLRSFQGSKKGLNRVVFSPDGKILALSGDDNTVRLLDRASGKELRKFDVSKDAPSLGLSIVAFSPDGKIVATAGADRAIRLWSVQTGEPLVRIDRQADIYRLAYSPDGRFLASGENERAPVFGKSSVHLWETATGREVRHWSLNRRWIDTVEFSPDGTSLAVSAATSSPIYIWDIGSGEQRMQLEIDPPKPPGINRKPRSLALAFSPDGKTLAASNERDSFIYLFEMATGKERGRFVGHRDFVCSLAFSPDGRRLASGSFDTTVLVWDATGLPASTGIGKSSVEQMQALWSDLADKDARKAFEAIGLLTASPEQAVPMLKSKLRPAPAAADRQQVARLIADLDNTEFVVRDRAMEQLRQLGERAEPALLESLKSKPALETRKRIEELMEKVKVLSITLERLREFRAIEVLEHANTADSRQVLKTLADGAAHARLTREAKAALKRLTQRDTLGK